MKKKRQCRICNQWDYWKKTICEPCEQVCQQIEQVHYLDRGPKVAGQKDRVKKYQRLVKDGKPIFTKKRP